MRVSEDTIDFLVSIGDEQAITAHQSWLNISRYSSNTIQVSANWSKYNTRLTDRFNHPDFYQTIGWFWFTLVSVPEKKTIHLKVLP